MGRVDLQEEHKSIPIEGGKVIRVVTMTHEEFDKFNPYVLDIGDIGLPSTRVEALAAIFDLAGFTTFSSQVDPHLAVPEYLNSFLSWLFEEIREGLVKESTDGEKTLWASLPFLAKFLGDGVLFLWDTKNMGGAEMCNIVTSLWEICTQYTTQFYPIVKRLVVQPPKVLRCGIARGMVVSVGNGEDYVGPCINTASRLQKVASLTCCISRRGFDLERNMPKETAANYILKALPIRGIGEEELVWIRREEYEKLSEQDRKLFKNP
jgi:class 3 adenylate cyclase